MSSVPQRSDSHLVPSWISKRSKRDLYGSIENGVLVSPEDAEYDPVQHASIFVAVAAFRDNECRNTVLQILEHAQYPDRIRFGIFTQNNLSDADCGDFRDVLNCDKERDYEHLFLHDDDEERSNKEWKQRYKAEPHPLCGRLWQIKMDRIDWRDGLGPTYGRYRAELFYDDEDYVLQMDSHTAFVQDWDRILIAMHLRLRNDYAVISTYPKPLKFHTLYHWEAPPARPDSNMYVICSTAILKEKVTKQFKLNSARVI